MSVRVLPDPLWPWREARGSATRDVAQGLLSDGNPMEEPEKEGASRPDSGFLRLGQQEDNEPERTGSGLPRNSTP